jgi:hypothetical protein
MLYLLYQPLFCGKSYEQRFKKTVLYVTIKNGPQNSVAPIAGKRKA